LNDLWQRFCDLEEEVQQAPVPTGDEHALRLTGLKEQVEKYLQVFKDNMASASGAQRSYPPSHNTTTPGND